MEPLSAYEIQRLKNIEFNKSVLRSLEIPRLDDLLPPRSVVTKPKQGVKRKRNDSGKKRKKRLSDLSLVGNGYMTRAKRRHLTNIENGEIVDENENGVDDDEDDLDYKKQKPKFNQNIFGSIPDIPVGTVWQFRSHCSHDGVHRATVAGIHGGADGCYSIALSGGYEDDVDYGDLFTYTGEGGRNLKGTKADPKNLRTAPQSKDQKLDRGNLALSKSVETGKPVRVVRGFKLKSPYAPAEGYRYDGLYTVEKFWNARGLSGFGVYRFALRRCPDQAPPPWLDQSQENQTSGDENQTEGDENQTDGDENQTEGNKNQTEGDENKTERDENQTEGDENKTERDEDQTERDENQTEGDENQTEEDKNQTEKDENQTERDENQTERDVNKTEGDENQTGYGNQTKRDEKQTETDEIQTEADKTQTESDETKQEMKTKHKRRRKPNRSR